MLRDDVSDLRSCIRELKYRFTDLSDRFANSSNRLRIRLEAFWLSYDGTETTRSTEDTHTCYASVGTILKAIL